MKKMSRISVSSTVVTMARAMKMARLGFIFVCLVVLAQPAVPPGNAQAEPTATSAPSSAPANPREGNLVFNGDLEKETSASPPDGWTMYGESRYKIPANYTRDTTNPHSGKACLRIHRPANTGGYIVSDPDQEKTRDAP